MNGMPFAPVVTPIERKGWFWFLKPQQYRVLDGHMRVACYSDTWIYCHVTNLPHPIWIRKSRLKPNPKVSW